MKFQTRSIACCRVGYVCTRFLSYTLHFGLTGAQRELAAFKGKTGSLSSALCRGTVWFVQTPSHPGIGGTFSMSAYVKSWMSWCSQKSMSKLRNFKVCLAAMNTTLLPQMGHSFNKYDGLHSAYFNVRIIPAKASGCIQVFKINHMHIYYVAFWKGRSITEQAPDALFSCWHCL